MYRRACLLWLCLSRESRPVADLPSLAIMLPCGIDSQQAFSSCLCCLFASAMDFAFAYKKLAYSHSDSSPALQLGGFRPMVFPHLHSCLMS